MAESTVGMAEGQQDTERRLYGVRALLHDRTGARMGSPYTAMVRVAQPTWRDTLGHQRAPKENRQGLDRCSYLLQRPSSSDP